MMMVMTNIVIRLFDGDDDYTQFHLSDEFVLLFHKFCLHIFGPPSLSVIIMMTTNTIIMFMVVMVIILFNIMDGLTYGSCLY